jgi:integrase
MVQTIKPRRRTNAKGEVYYQLRGPDPKTGKRIYYKKETFRGPNAYERAKKRVHELIAAHQTLTATGKLETRTVAHLVGAFLDDVEGRYSWTKQTRQWFVRGRSLRSDTRRRYRDNCRRFILPELAPILLINLELEDIQLMVNKVWDGVSESQARSAGESIKTIISWGDEHGYAMPPLLHRLLHKGKLLLPPKRVREYDMELLRPLIMRCLAVVFGPRTGKTNRRGYLHRRILWTMGIANGLRRSEFSTLHMADIDWTTGTVKIANGLDRLTGEILEGATKTRSGQRRLWLPRYALEAIVYKERLWPGEKLLFTPDRGKNIYWGMGSAYMRKVCEEAGLTKEETDGVMHWHGLRHMFATNMDAAAVPKAEQKLALGHSRIDRNDPTTSGYIHITSPNRAFEEAERALELLMPQKITPLEEALTLAKTGFHRLTPGEKNLYIREYKRRRRAERQLALAAPGDNTGTNQD